MSKWKSWPTDFTLSATPNFPSDFPLTPPHCEGPVSAYTPSYNCIAWAAQDDQNWWEPDPDGNYFWPDGAIRAYTKDGYISAYQAVGFEICEDGELEQGSEKIALYADKGQPTHAARQLESGKWTSKLGPYEDIQHLNPQCLNGPLYGGHLVFMKRPRPL